MTYCKGYVAWDYMSLFIQACSLLTHFSMAQLSMRCSIKLVCFLAGIDDAQIEDIHSKYIKFSISMAIWPTDS